MKIEYLKGQHMALGEASVSSSGNHTKPSRNARLAFSKKEKKKKSI